MTSRTQKRDVCFKCGAVLHYKPWVVANYLSVCRQCMRSDKARRIRELRQRYHEQQAIEDEIMTQLLAIHKKVASPVKETREYAFDPFHLRDEPKNMTDDQSSTGINLNRCQKLDLQWHRTTSLAKDEDNGLKHETPVTERKEKRPNAGVLDSKGCGGDQTSKTKKLTTSGELIESPRKVEKDLNMSTQCVSRVTPTKGRRTNTALTRSESHKDTLNTSGELKHRMDIQPNTSTKVSKDGGLRKSPMKRFCNRELIGEVTRYDNCIGECPRCRAGFPRSSFIPLVALKCGHFYHRECFCDVVFEGNMTCETCGAALIT